MIRVHEIDAELTGKRIASLADKLTATYGKFSQDKECKANWVVFDVVEGKKFDKIVRRYTEGNGRSVYAFINKETGDIFKPASWAAPAKHARGNVNDADNGMHCCNEFSIVYLR